MADLHIGKFVNGYSMIDDQRFILEQVLDHIEKEAPDALILAGDIYDRRNPPVEAVTLFDEFLSKVILDCHIPVLAIGGNHDAGERLSFGNHILSKAGYHISGNFGFPIPKLVLEDEFGEVAFHLMAYADLSLIRSFFPEEDHLKYADMMAHIIEQIDCQSDQRHVLIAHGMVIGEDPLEESDSERALNIGGTEFWRSKGLEKFDYVALGHLHRQQKTGSDTIQYSGSMLPYSFSEERHQKVILCVTLEEKGHISIVPLPLYPRHNMVTVSGTLHDFLDKPDLMVKNRDDYLRIILEDKGALIEPMQRLKKIFPNIMMLERAQQIFSTSFVESSFANVKNKMSELDLFDEFYKFVENMPPDDKTREAFGKILGKMKGAHSDEA